MNGHLIAGTPIAVDYFRSFSGDGDRPNKLLYFLTHAHTDHMVGLTHTWRSGRIFMSAVTARIVHHERKVAKMWLVVLEVGESKVIQLENTTESIVVTPIDARHCAGSVMFLFQGKFGNILYTGDIRFCDPSMLNNEALCQCSFIHRLYLDNTYCEPLCEFPTREVATADVIDLVAASHPDRRVFIGITKLGKEELLVRVALHFGVPIVVAEGTYKFFQVLESLQNVFSTDLDASRIHAVTQAELRRHARDDACHDDLLIMPTAIEVGHAGGHARKSVTRIVYVPYSNHSTFKELVAFVASVRPREIVPIVNYGRRMMCGWEISCRSDMSVFDHLIDKRPMVTEELLFKPMSMINISTSRVGETSPRPSLGPPKLSLSKLPRTKPVTLKPSKCIEFIDDLNSTMSSEDDCQEIIHYCNTSSSGERSPMEVAFTGDILTVAQDEIPVIGQEVEIGPDVDSDNSAIETDMVRVCSGSCSVDDAVPEETPEEEIVQASPIDKQDVSDDEHISQGLSMVFVCPRLDLTTCYVDIISHGEGMGVADMNSDASLARLSGSPQLPEEETLPEDTTKDNDDEEKSALPHSIDEKKRNRNQKNDLRTEWEQLARIFRKKRLTNEIPLYLSKDKQCLLKINP